MKKKKQFPAWLYDRLFRLWVFYALKVLRVPFVVYYAPKAEEQRILGITFTWTLDYAQRIKKLESMERELVDLRQRFADIAKEKEGDSNGESMRHEGSI